MSTNHGQVGNFRAWRTGFLGFAIEINLLETWRREARKGSVEKNVRTKTSLFFFCQFMIDLILLILPFVTRLNGLFNQIAKPNRSEKSHENITRARCDRLWLTKEANVEMLTRFVNIFHFSARSLNALMNYPHENALMSNQYRNPLINI